MTTATASETPDAPAPAAAPASPIVAPPAAAAPPLLRVVDLHKTHVLRHQAAFSVKELAVRRMFRRAPVETIEALRGVSLDVHEGEIVGVIGRNGAGKSTLLRILAGITAPDAGRVQSRGRMAAMLELGAGFHPDLSGMENIFLAASLAGIARRDVLARLEAIIDFSGVRPFIYTPIKHYSSGMLVRLGFAVAAHFDPAVLVLDEVMAVGDGAFQRKCRRHIETLVRGGTGVLLVSHDLALIEAVCDRVLWLDAGRARLEGEASEVVAAYLEEQYERRLAGGGPMPFAAEVSHHLDRVRFGSGELLILEPRTRGADGRRRSSFHWGERVEIVFDVRRPLDSELDPNRGRQQPYGLINIQLGISRTDHLGICHYHLMRKGGEPLRILEPGETVAVCLAFDRMTFAPGSYSVSVGAYPAEAGAFATLEFYPFDCHLRLFDFAVLAPPDGTHIPEGAVGLEADVTVEALPPADTA